MTSMDLRSRDFGRDMLETLEELERRCNIKLSMKQRLLLSERGSLEQVLSIITGNPIKVEVIGEKPEEPTAITADVVMEGVEREVWLTDSSGELLYAKSICNTSEMPLKIVDALLTRKPVRGGIGTILMQHNIETYRRIIGLGYDERRKTLYRKYEIVHGGKVWFTVFEEFSAQAFL